MLFLGEDDDFSISVQLAGSAGEVAKGDWEALDAVSHRALQPFERGLFRRQLQYAERKIPHEHVPCVPLGSAGCNAEWSTEH